MTGLAWSRLSLRQRLNAGIGVVVTTLCGVIAVLVQRDSTHDERCEQKIATVEKRASDEVLYWKTQLQLCQDKSDAKDERYIQKLEKYEAKVVNFDRIIDSLAKKRQK